MDEDVPAETGVEAAVTLLAERKARAVSSRHPDDFVLGADQLVQVDGNTLGKPADREDAREQLTRLGRSHHALVTGICLLGPGFFATAVETTRLTLYPFDPGELERYLDSGEWQGCAGGYRVEGLGQWLMAGIDGDRTNVQGLPMVSVVRLLREAGIRGF